MYDDLIETYLQDGRAVLAALEDATVRLWLEADRSAALEDLAVLTHRLRGTAALYSHPQTAGLSGLLERLLEGRASFPETVIGGLVGVLECAHVCLEGALGRVSAGGDEGAVGLEFSRLGGAAQLMALIQTYPEAFRPLVAAGSGGAENQLSFAQAQAELWSFFAPEARELVETLRNQLEGGGHELDAMFRAAHTLKGSAAMVGFLPLSELGHTLEDLLGHVREGGTSTERAAPLLGEGLALAGRLLAAAEGQEAVPEVALQDYRTRTHALIRGEVVSMSGVEREGGLEAAPVRLSVRVGGEQLDAMLEGVGKLVTSRARLNVLLGQQRALADHLDETHVRVQHILSDFEKRYLNPTVGRSSAAQAGGIPVSDTRLSDFSVLELDTYSDLNVLARSLAELSADLLEVRAGTHAGLTELTEEVAGLDKAARTLRTDVGRVRRTPFSRATAPLRRWAHERMSLALHMEGEDILLDAATVPPLAQALLHLVTNAAVHGLESAQERAACGKTPTGTVTVTARAQGGHLVVMVQDDGRGLPLTALRERALAAGHAGAAELQNLSDAQVMELVFLPGLSTADTVTREAGRGVGMDAVRSAIESLGGHVRLRSAPGIGTTVTLQIPLVQQITGVLIARVGRVRLALLAEQVRGLRLLEEHSEAGAAAPLDLHALWGESPGTTRHVARLDTGDDWIEVIVDEFTHLEEVVLRPAGALLGALGYLVGTAVSEDGRALPVLNPAGLAAVRSPPKSPGQSSLLSSDISTGRILLVDDSLSVRRHLGRALMRAGFTVLTAVDGREALERLLSGTESVDLVLTDLEMPHTNGFEVIQGLRGHEATAKLPVVVMTTRTGDKHQQLALSLGADDYFAKPANEGRLVRRLGELLTSSSFPGGFR